jgi:hypothetical protein
MLPVDGPPGVDELLVDPRDLRLQLTTAASNAGGVGSGRGMVDGLDGGLLREAEEEHRVLTPYLREGGLGGLWVQRSSVLIHEAMLDAAILRPAPELHSESIPPVVVPGEGGEYRAVRRARRLGVGVGGEGEGKADGLGPRPPRGSMEVAAAERLGKGGAGAPQAKTERIEDACLAVIVLADENGHAVQVELQAADAPEVLDEDPGEVHA